MKKIKYINGIIEGLVDINDIKNDLNKKKEAKIIELSVSDDIINKIKNKPESMRTYSEQQKLIQRNRIEEEYNIALSKYDDYRELVVIPYVGKYNEEIETLTPKFRDLGDKVEQTFVLEISKQKIKRLISDNQKILTETDYIIIKSYEAKLSMSDAPYNQEYLDEVISRRQAARDKINELVALLND